MKDIHRSFQVGNIKPTEWNDYERGKRFTTCANRVKDNRLRIVRNTPRNQVHQIWLPVGDLQTR